MGDLDEFFAHENHSYPPALSQGGNLRFGTKSDLIPCLSSTCIDSTLSTDITQLSVDTYILDGAVITQMIQPGYCKTFQKYGETMFLPYVRTVARKNRQVDTVFDTYVTNSLKTATREKCGTGIRTLVTAATTNPKNWQAFELRADNKTDLFHVLADLVCNTSAICEHVLVTYDEHGHCKTDINKHSIDPCSHKEADTRIILLCSHAAENGSKKVAIRTVDTDVVVLAIAFFRS